MLDTEKDVIIEQKVVNFLDMRQKKDDWRYKAYSTIRQQAQTKTIYWIATVFLPEVSEKTDQYGMRYFRNGHNVQAGEYAREVDGELTGRYIEYLFNLSEFKSEMLRAKREDYNFYSIFIEETVNGYGCHHVDGLYLNKQGEVPTYGIASHTPWYKMPVDYFLDVTHFVIDENVERIPLLGQGSYTWIK